MHICADSMYLLTKIIQRAMIYPIYMYIYINNILYINKIFGFRASRGTDCRGKSSGPKPQVTSEQPGAVPTGGNTIHLRLLCFLKFLPSLPPLNALFLLMQAKHTRFLYPKTVAQKAITQTPYHTKPNLNTHIITTKNFMSLLFNFKLTCFPQTFCSTRRSPARPGHTRPDPTRPARSPPPVPAPTNSNNTKYPLQHDDHISIAR